MKNNLKELNPSRVLGTCQIEGCYNKPRAPTKRANGNYRYYSTCRECNNYNSRYGLTKPLVTTLSEAQDNKCAICDTQLDWSKSAKANSAVVDHCHRQGFIRGILCNHCNRALGLFKDSISSLEKAIIYLGDSNDSTN